MAWLVAYLASPAGDFYSGCVITIDGARDNWFGSWPPGGAEEGASRSPRSGESGAPPALNGSPAARPRINGAPRI